MCVGNITTADQVNTILAAGRADLVALGAAASRRPVLHHEGGGLVRRRRRSTARRSTSPGKDQIFRNRVRDRADMEDLRLRAKPKTRAELKAEREAERKLAAE